MEGQRDIIPNGGVPELTELGKRIEMLRIARGISKQHLARYAGTSRQQLWRVMTGKSELTSTLRARLADVLAVSTLELGNPAFEIRAAVPALEVATRSGSIATQGTSQLTLTPAGLVGVSQVDPDTDASSYLADG